MVWLMALGLLQAAFVLLAVVLAGLMVGMILGLLFLVGLAAIWRK